MGLSTGEVDLLAGLMGDVPEWVATAPYVGAAHPQAGSGPISEGANCQRFAYAVLDHTGRSVPPHWSSELWADEAFEHPRVPDELEPFDLVLFGGSPDAHGAHLAVWLGHECLLHLCAEVGVPAIWWMSDFAARERYRHVVGAVRVPPIDPASR